MPVGLSGHRVCAYSEVKTKNPWNWSLKSTVLERHEGPRLDVFGIVENSLHVDKNKVM